MMTELTRRLFVFAACAGVACAVMMPQVASGAMTEPVASRDEVMSKAVAYLKAQQDPASGGWCISKEAPTFPAITGLVLSGMIGSGKVAKDDPAVAAGVKFILNAQQSDGGIYVGMLPSYNTAICLSTLAMVSDMPGVEDARKRALAFLRTLQNGDEAPEAPASPEFGQKLDAAHPFYGGVGYGKHGRPDLSNTAFFVDALHASGVDGSDAAMQRALVFLQRVQMLERTGDMKVNEMAYAAGSRQGGFIYATSENKDKVGSGQSFAGMIDESLSDGTTASRLRSYGSMTYAGFKSYLYAGLKKDDPRVVAAREWIGKNYTLEENPAAGTDGLYYYYLVFAKALAADGQAMVRVVDADGTVRQQDWRKDLGEKLASLQQADGSFKVVDDRWMENNPVLITAYGLDALARTR
jgi:squalene-hopene/tetraprenyl-beta-curcumene cyclase